MRLAFGLLIAPLVAAMVFTSTSVGLAMACADVRPTLEGLLTNFAFACVYAYPIGVGLGLPSFLVYERLGLVSLASYVLGGLVGGFAVGAALVRPFPEAISLWGPIVLSAVVSCAFFWLLLARRGGQPKRVHPTASGRS